MQAYVLFRNNNDVSVNKLICTKTGETAAYNAAMQLFKERKIPCHYYIIIRKDNTKKCEPSVISNLFGELPEMGKAPWIFDFSV